MVVCMLAFRTPPGKKSKNLQDGTETPRGGGGGVVMPERRPRPRPPRRRPVMWSGMGGGQAASAAPARKELTAAAHPTLNRSARAQPIEGAGVLVGELEL